jgi:glucose uptake protein GlcU
MLKIAAVLFAISAVGGLTLATLHFKNKNRPFGLAILHGLLGAGGIISLIMAAMSLGFAGLLAISLVIFVVAALGGFLLFSYHLRKQPLPSAMVIIHGLAAVSAFLILLVVIFR